MVPNCAYGIDLGTSNIKIYSLSDDSVMMEKNMIAIENKKNIFAYGNSAYEMYEKAPANIQISHPLSNGVIADINNMERLIHLFISDMSKGNIRPADFYIAVPTDITEVEKRAFYDLIKDANVKARKIMVVEKAIADGLGMDIDVKNSQGVLVVDIGYDTTEVSILSLGGIVLSRLIKTGGLKFDEAVRQTVRREFNLLIGQKTAATIRQSIGDLEKEGKGAVVYLSQEGRGIGLFNKIAAYKLQDEGLDTVDANVRLGFGVDERDYGVGASIIREMGIKHMRLMTNNPLKRVGLEGYGLKIDEIVPIVIAPNKYNERYLETKQERMHHKLNLYKH